MPSLTVVILSFIQEEAHCNVNTDLCVVVAQGKGRVVFAKCSVYQHRL